MIHDLWPSRTLFIDWIGCEINVGCQFSFRIRNRCRSGAYIGYGPEITPT
jgi:hypothetical protein